MPNVIAAILLSVIMGPPMLTAGVPTIIYWGWCMWIGWHAAGADFS